MMQTLEKAMAANPQSNGTANGTVNGTTNGAATVMAALRTKETNKHAGQTIGAILIDAGRITLEQAESILRMQREQGMQFGEAAIALGLLQQTDIEFALSRQFSYPYLTRGHSSLSAELVAAYDPFNPQVETLRALRSQLMLRWFGADHHVLAVTSAAGGEGCSFVAANLAIVFSQLGERTLLVDANMRTPRIHKLFGLENRTGLSSMLSDRDTPGSIQRIPAFVDLSVLPAGSQPPNPHELLSRSNFNLLLGHLSAQYDIVLIDTPAGSVYPDAAMVASRAGGALVVARNHVSQVSALRTLIDSLGQSQTMVLGTVLNEF